MVSASQTQKPFSVPVGNPTFAAGKSSQYCLICAGSLVIPQLRSLGSYFLDTWLFLLPGGAGNSIQPLSAYARAAARMLSVLMARPLSAAPAPLASAF